MRKVFVFTILLLFGLVLSQSFFNEAIKSSGYNQDWLSLLTYTGLGYIMFFVGLEFNLNKNNIRSYKTDYIVAFTAATFPWIFTALYFLFTQFPTNQWSNLETWEEILFVGRFAAPTSAGILFTMLAAAGLAGTWVYKKVRILAIFDDLDTVLLLIPLKVMVIGLAWQLGVVLFVMIGLCFLAWFFFRKWNLPVHGFYPLFYSVIMAAVSHGVYVYTKGIDPSAAIHIEVLFPAFVLGLMIKLSDEKYNHIHLHDKYLTIVGGVFMILVGLNMPYVLDQFSGYTTSMWMILIGHVFMITLLSNIGKMYVLFNYKKEASFRERLAVGVGMMPRGEVGAGVLIMAIGFGFSEKILTIAMASLIVNFILTGLFIYIVKKLVVGKSKNENKQQMYSLNLKETVPL